jgi:hypothetical protein
MTMQFDAQTEFTQRIERIRAGGQGTNRTLFVGMDGAMAIPRDFKPAAKPRRKRGALVWLVTLAVLGAAGFAMMQAGLLPLAVALPV